MRRMLPLMLMCTLTQPAIMVDMQDGRESKFEKYDRVRILLIKDGEAVVQARGGYYRIESGKLICR